MGIFLAGQNDLALAQWHKALDLEANLSIAHTSIWLVYAQKGATGTLVPPVKEEPGDTSPLDLRGDPRFKDLLRAVGFQP